MNLWVIAAAAAAVTIAFGAGAYTGSEWSNGQCAIKISEREKAGEEAKDAWEKGAREANEKALAAILEANKKRPAAQRIIEERVRENIVYRECQHDADVLRQLNALLSGTGVAGQDASKGKLP